MKLKFMLDYETNPLWANDETSLQKFGYHIDNLKELGLSDKTIALADFVSTLYYYRLNPIYPILPTFWSGRMHLFFQTKVNELFNEIIDEIGNSFEIENKESEEMMQQIEIAKIDLLLEDFIENPISYFRKQGISYNDTTAIKTKYEEWKQKEIMILKKNDFY